jgi:hypothetical protein
MVERTIGSQGFRRGLIKSLSLASILLYEKRLFRFNVTSFSLEW